MIYFAQLTDSEIIKHLTALIFWVGGFMSAPIVFMATMGIFRNLAGMGQSLTGKLGGKIREPGRKERERYKGFRRANTEMRRNIAAERRVAVGAAGSVFTRRGRAARSATGTAMDQQLTQRQAEQAIQDAAYTWKNDGDLNYEYVRARGDVNQLRRNGVSEENIQRMLMMENKYGRRAMLEAAHTQAIVGKAGAYGPGNEEAVWHDAAAIAGDDDHALASIVARGRSAALAAGWGSVGGGSFTGTMSFARGGSLDVYRDDVIDSTGASTLFHPSMTDQSIQQISQRLAERALEARQAVTTAATPEAREAARRAYGQRLADIANAYDQMRALPGRKGDIAADQMLGVGVVEDGITIRDSLEMVRSDKDRRNAFSMGYHEKRYEYGSERAERESRPTTPTDIGAGPTTNADT